jgi:hypothetical protein
MAKTLVALGTAAAIGAAALTTFTPAAAQPWVAPVVAGSVITGAFVGAAVASSPYNYRPRGLFGYNYPNHCGCASYHHPAYAEPADPYVNAQPYYEQQYEQPYYQRYEQPYAQPYYQRYEQPYAQPYYQRYAQPYARPYYQRHASYRPYGRPYVRPYYRANYRRW